MSWALAVRQARWRTASQELASEAPEVDSAVPEPGLVEREPAAWARSEQVSPVLSQAESCLSHR